VIGLSLPEPGAPFGWSVAAGEITAALQELTDVKVITNDDFPVWIYQMPVLHAIQGPNFLPLRPGVESAVRDIGYLFIEDTTLARRYVVNAARHFNHLVTGSSWCTQEMTAIFGEIGIPVTTAIQGIGWRFFEIPQRGSDDKFIVFSGGKAEFRKGQDIAIRAMRIFMHRHNDVWLNTAWHNPWGAKIPGYAEIVEASKRLDPARVIGSKFESVPHKFMQYHYSSADIGLFPNRCEAGTNLVMMELMACGRPVIATYATGHKDVLDKGSYFNLIQSKPLTVRGPDGLVIGEWVEPDLDEILATLEFAYHNRDEARRQGEANRARMRQFTWEACAREFLKVLEPERLALDVRL